MIRSSACQQQADTHPPLWDEPWSSKLHHVMGHDLARVGIVTWYYGIYGAASAMIAAADGSFPETHAATTR